jgi:hypothetical protein
MDFETTLSILLGFVGRQVFVEVRTAGNLEVVTLRGTLAAGDDVGKFEREHGVAEPGHDRLLFTMREHPFPEGFFLDHRTFEAAEWRREVPDRELLIKLVGGMSLAIIEDMPWP